MVELININKSIGRKSILRDINMTLKYGTVYGLNGINGSGKTMIMKIICGLVVPTSGQIIIDEKKINTVTRFPDSIGVLIENPVFLPYYTGFANLKLLGDIKGKISDDEIKEQMKRTGFNLADDKMFRKYSLGMKQKLGIAAAVMEKPNIILLDEPFNGLDADSIQKVKKIILEEKERGALIILTCHDKEIFNELVDWQFTISEGAIIDEKDNN